MELEGVVNVEIGDRYRRAQRTNVELIACTARGSDEEIARQREPPVTGDVISAPWLVADEHVTPFVNLGAYDEPFATSLAELDDSYRCRLTRSLGHRRPTTLVALEEGSELLHGPIKIPFAPSVKEKRALRRRIEVLQRECR